MTRTGVKDIPGTLEDVTTRQERASQRYIKLIEELSHEEEGRKHGWQSRVARLVDIDQSYISRLSRKEKVNPRADAIERAMAALRLRPEYFYGVAEPRSYHDFTYGNEPTFPGWMEFRSKPPGNSLTEGERIKLTSIVWSDGEAPSAAFYEGTLFNIRQFVTKSEMERGIQKAAELDEKLAKKRPRKG